MHTVSVLMRLGSFALPVPSTRASGFRFSACPAPSRISSKAAPASPGMKPQALLSGPALCNWSFCSSHSSVSGSSQLSTPATTQASSAPWRSFAQAACTPSKPAACPASKVAALPKTWLKRRATRD